jgi:hypothetical protein
MTNIIKNYTSDSVIKFVIIETKTGKVKVAIKGDGEDVYRDLISFNKNCPLGRYGIINGKNLINKDDYFFFKNVEDLEKIKVFYNK